MNYIKSGKDRFSVISFTSFVTIVITMFSLTMLLLINLTGSIDQLMDVAKTPSFIQMHSGELNTNELDNFTKDRDEILDSQIVNFLNIDNSIIKINGQALINNTQDNGLCVQGDRFDYMLDLNNQIPQLKQGEVYIPICYQSLYNISIGDTLTIGDASLNISGFIRDSQMNSMMASSKRFLVTKEDYNLLSNIGSEEYLLEYLLKDGTDTNAFKTAYENANLPMNGPTITKPLIKMMNMLSDGIMIGIILLVSILVFLISMVCIRYVLLTRIAIEAKEVGISKAIGISRKDIRHIFFMRYLKLIIIGGVIGILLSGLLFQPLSIQMQALYGAGANAYLMILYAILGAIVVGTIILLFVIKILKKLNDMTAIKALTKQVTNDKKNPNKISILLVTCITLFLMMIPSNLYSTMSSPDFVTYMGIGNGQIRMDIKYSDHSESDFTNLVNALSIDKDVSEYALYQTSSRSTLLTDGTKMNLLMEQGNHTLFPVSYSQGRAPERDKEVALSYMLANELNLNINDTLLVNIKNNYEECKITGIYSDITNGGKTAKLYTNTVDPNENIMWSIIYLSLNKNVDQNTFITKYSTENVEVMDIASRVSSLYGPTLNQIQMASILINILAGIIILIVILMFVKLMIAKERNKISLKKAIGICNFNVKLEYWKIYLPYMIIGIAIGVILGNTLGEFLCGIVMKSFGAASFAFSFNIWSSLVNILVGALATALAIYMGLREIRNIKAVEACKGRE